MSCDWWHSKPRRINIIIDNASWIVAYAQELCEIINKEGDKASFITSYESVKEADVSFYLGCIRITPFEVLSKSKINLVVHESDLPAGKGFSPLSWQILEGKNIIPICLLEMTEKVDSGAVIFRDAIEFEGHELVDELRKKQGDKTVQLCSQYLQSAELLQGMPQVGIESYYKRRQPKDSKLDVSKSILESFNLLRIVDNEKYPAFFDLNGCRYIVKISKFKINHD